MINFTSVKNIILTAALSGVLAGLLLTVIQHFGVMPALFEAEVYEQAASEAILKGPEEWEPEDGTERTLFTGLANISVAFSFAMLLGAAILVSGKQVTWRSGLLWGLAGYAVFFIAPALGLPPEVPGTEAAALQHRQVWWVATVLATAIGLALLVFMRNWPLKVSGLLLAILPHLISAPHPEVLSSTAPQAIVQAFIYSTTLANLFFWLALGGLQGMLTKTD